MQVENRPEPTICRTASFKKNARISRWRARVTVAVCQLLLALASCLLAGIAMSEGISLTQAESIGRRIYQKGMGISAVEVNFAASGTRARGSDYPCISCHGEAGKGGREAGVEIADISSAALAARLATARGTTSSNASDHLLAAITEGMNPYGGSLHAAMPRYQFSKADMSNLLAYLKRLGNEPIPGVTDKEIRIGMVLPPVSLTTVARDVRRLLETYFNEVNQLGGIYGRMLALDAQSALGVDNKEIASPDIDSVFCFIAHPPIESRRDTWLALENIPVIAPLMIFPESVALKTPNVFYVYANIHDQGRTLMDFLDDRATAKLGTIALLYTEDAFAGAGAEGARQQAKTRGIRIVFDRPVQPNGKKMDAAVDVLQRLGVDQVIYFGSMSGHSLLNEMLRARGMRPMLLGSAELLGGNVAKAEGFGETYLASSIGMPDMASQGMSDYLRLVQQSGLASMQNPFLLNAYVGAKVLTEALKQNGKALSRASIIRTLERIRQFQTGVGPALTFSENQHRGTSAVTVMSFDARTGNLTAQTPFREARESP